MSCITTFTGKSINPLNTSAEEIDLSDISHALSLLCRANGHLPHFYSVAQHSINCANEAMARGYSVRVQLGCLLHDGSEAYLSDITRPVKPLLPNYLDIEKSLQNTIYDKWISPALNCDELEKIRIVDNAILHYEFLLMMKTQIGEEVEIMSNPLLDFVDFTIIEKEFARKFNILTGDNIGVGIDWMNKSWLAAELVGTVASLRTFGTIDDVCTFYADVPKILADVPIGLPSDAKDCSMRPDDAARKYIKFAKRKTSVFNTPTREIVYAPSPAIAWDIKQNTGVKISKQGLDIIPSIKQADVFLRENSSWKTRLVESHPECAFQSLNFGRGLEFSKHSDEGIALRCDILAKYVSNIYDLVYTANKKEREDILDAVCLAVTAKVGFESISRQTFFDEYNIPMRIVVAK